MAAPRHQPSGQAGSDSHPSGPVASDEHPSPEVHPASPEGHPSSGHHPSPEAHRASVEAALTALRDAGGRVTDGRRAIVTAVLAGDDHHVTADELAAALRADHPGLALSTIYRTLDALEELGIVARVDLGQGRAVYHPIDHAHHHLVCSTCGAVEEVPGDTLDPIAADLDARVGFALARQQLTLTGTCARCR